MSVGKADIQEFLRAEAIKLTGAAMMNQKPAVFEEIFDVMDDPRERSQYGQLHASGSMKLFGAGTERPQTQPFAGGMTTIEPNQYGESRGFKLVTLEEAKAKGWELRDLTNNWAQSYTTSRDKLASNVIKNGTSGTGYDGKALFATDHPRRSRYGDGTAISNMSAAGAAISDATVKAVHVAFAETMAIAENGEEINNDPTHVIATRITDQHELIAVLTSEKIAGVANNDVNVLKPLGLKVAYMPRARQASGTQYWYMAKAKGGLLFVDKEKLTAEAWYKNETREHFVGPAFQAAAGYRDFRAIYRQEIA